MAIEIIYSNFKLNEGADPCEIKKLMIRDSSWGTFVEKLVAAEKSCNRGALERWKKIEPELRNLQEGRYEDERFSLTFPKENFNLEEEGIDHLISTIAGDIILYHSIKQIVVEDFNIKDPELFEDFPGPNIGVEKLYSDMFSETLGGCQRPILAFTVKPRSGLNVKDYESVFSHAADGNIDIIEDDERLIDPPYCPFRERVNAISKIQKNYKSLYSVNITGSLDKAIQRLEYAVEKGIKMVKVDVLVTGFETLRQIALFIKRNYESRVAITVYPDAYRTYRKLSRKFILKMARLCGADIIYAGSPKWARYEREGGSFKEAIEPIHNMHTILSENFTYGSHIEKTLPTITNDQHPSRAELITAFLRRYYDNHFKYAFFVGGGISGFPDNLTNSVSEWLNCIEHAMTYDINDYKGYNFDKYEKKFEEMGWEYIDVKEAIKT